MNIAEKTLQLKQDFDNVYEAGKKAEYDAFWDSINTLMVARPYLFSGAAWNDTTFNPNRDIILTGNCTCAFSNNGCSNIKQRLQEQNVRLDLSNVTNFGQGFYYSQSTELPELDLSNCSVIGSVFAFSKVKIIDKVTFKDGIAFSNPFQNCTYLEELRIGGTIGQNGFNVQWSTKLTHDSLISIMIALADKTGDTSGTEWVATVGSENKAKLTDEELDIAQNKGWQVK